MAEYHTVLNKHLGQVAKAQLVTQAPEHHEDDDVGQILHPVQLRAGSFVELLAALVVAEALVVVRIAFASFYHRRRPTLNTT